MRPGGAFGKLFMGRYYFTIALRNRSSEWNPNQLFRAEMVFPATEDHWFADPILVDDEDRTWLFYEAVKGQKGHIEVVEVLDGCRVSDPTVILEDACHYSYPFVFSSQGTWYMIPESSAAEEVRLYRAISFPYTWELQTVLLRERAVDSTVFEHNGIFWLLTFFTDHDSERVIPHAYTLKDWKNPVLSEVPWPDYDPLRVRGAGPILNCGNRLIRPAQISQEFRYGDGLVFYSVDAEEQYQEKPEAEWLEKNIRASGYFVDGLHTYSSGKRYEAIDIRCRKAEPFKLVKRLTHR